MSQKFSVQDVTKNAKLANIPVKDSEKVELATSFTTTINIVDQLSAIDVTGFAPVSQVTGLENVFREDKIDRSRILTQESVFANTNKKKHNGYFVVPQLLDQVR